MADLKVILAKLIYTLKEFFKKKPKAATELYSPFGIPDSFLVKINKRIKVIIDPTKNYFKIRLNSDRKNFEYLILIHGCEPPEINDVAESIIENANKFDEIYSFDSTLLRQIQSAKTFSFGSCWVATDSNEQLVSLKKDYHQIFDYNKKFRLSYIKSDKNKLPGHQLRFSLNDTILKKRNYKLIYPQQRIDTKVELFKDTAFHIAIENSKHENYFTEKIIDCFMSYTIPIYWGCPNIDSFFDKEGIIFFNDKKELESILDNLTMEDYFKRIEAVKRNYQIALDNYAFFFDRVNDYICSLEKNG
jgi:hypothetical protein